MSTAFYLCPVGGACLHRERFDPMHETDDPADPASADEASDRLAEHVVAEHGVTADEVGALVSQAAVRWSYTAVRELLLDRIRTEGGEWTVGRVKRLCSRYVPSHILRSTIRRHLARLHDEGHLVRHETPGRRYYTAAGGGQ